MSYSPRISVLLLAVLVALILPAATQAKAPPRGKYDCTISGILFGVLQIKGNQKYGHRGSRGTFRAKGGRIRFSDGRRGWKISFKRGTLGGFKGRWYHTSDGLDEIALENPRNGFESIYCDSR